MAKPPWIVWQGFVGEHDELESFPVFDIHAMGAANSGATCKNAVRTMVTAKSFAIIRIMSSPYDVTSGGGDIIV